MLWAFQIAAENADHVIDNKRLRKENRSENQLRKFLIDNQCHEGILTPPNHLRLQVEHL